MNSGGARLSVYCLALGERWECDVQRSTNHLKYTSIFAWIRGENIPPLASIKDARVRDGVFAQLAELRQHLFKKHLEAHSQFEQEQIRTGLHPSQDVTQFDQARSFANELKAHLRSTRGMDVSVMAAEYHYARLILAVDVPADPGDLLLELPSFYRGFEVKYSWPVK